MGGDVGGVAGVRGGGGGVGAGVREGGWVVRGERVRPRLVPGPDASLIGLTLQLLLTLPLPAPCLPCLFPPLQGFASDPEAAPQQAQQAQHAAGPREVMPVSLTGGVLGGDGMTIYPR